MMSIDINAAWSELRGRIEQCRRCPLCETRTNAVVGDGPVDSRVVLVGEAPGQDEDLSGHPFVGRAGQLLTDILEKGGNIPRASLYITNIIKCRPPGNRDPKPEEVSSCREHIEAQLALIHPDVIVTLGNFSTQGLLKVKTGITRLRGQWLDWRGIKVFPMFHPSYLLRRESAPDGMSLKRLTWQDVQALKAKIDSLN